MRLLPAIVHTAAIFALAAGAAQAGGNYRDDARERDHAGIRVAVQYYAPGYYPGYDYAYPYAPPPVYYAPPPQVIYTQPAPSGAAPPQSWYYCDNPKGYYPNVSQCSVQWRQVPATPPAAPPVGKK